MSGFKTWWETEGSAMRPQSNEDIEEFAKRLTEIAWSNGEYVEREACAKVCEEMYRRDGFAAVECEAADECAAAIRARSST